MRALHVVAVAIALLFSRQCGQTKLWVYAASETGDSTKMCVSLCSTGLNTHTTLSAARPHLQFNESTHHDKIHWNGIYWDSHESHKYALAPMESILNGVCVNSIYSTMNAEYKVSTIFSRLVWLSHSARSSFCTEYVCPYMTMTLT